jgi:beta-glucosidase
VSVDVTNTGPRAGEEVVQLYARHTASKVDRPNKDLRGYARIALRPGESRTVSFALSARSLAYWDATGHRWVVEREPVELQVGASSADIRARRTVSVVP